MKLHRHFAGVIFAVLALTAVAGERMRPTREQAEAVRRLRSRAADMPVPAVPMQPARADAGTGLTTPSTMLLTVVFP